MKLQAHGCWIGSFLAGREVCPEPSRYRSDSSGTGISPSPAGELAQSARVSFTLPGSVLFGDF